MKGKITFLFLIICLGNQTNTRAENEEVESIYKKPCDLSEKVNCFFPYLTCENVDGAGLCIRKGFFPMEGIFAS